MKKMNVLHMVSLVSLLSVASNALALTVINDKNTDIKVVAPGTLYNTEKVLEGVVQGIGFDQPNAQAKIAPSSSLFGGPKTLKFYEIHQKEDGQGKKVVPKYKLIQHFSLGKEGKDAEANVIKYSYLEKWATRDQGEYQVNPKTGQKELRFEVHKLKTKNKQKMNEAHEQNEEEKYTSDASEYEAMGSALD